MAGKSKSNKRKQIVYMIPEGETRDSHTYHYTAVKTKTLIQENRKLKMKKYNPVKRKHEMFVEAKLPKHQK
jgi:large subunit ribosomal protein L33